MSETAIAGGLPAISVAQGIPSPSGAERDAGITFDESAP
jgi:hypothetical protein